MFAFLICLAPNRSSLPDPHMRLVPVLVSHARSGHTQASMHPSITTSLSADNTWGQGRGSDRNGGRQRQRQGM